MGTTITITLSDDRLEELRAEAEETNKSLSQVIESRLEADDSPFYQDPRQPFMLREQAAYEQMHPELVQNYLGKYVAITGGQLVDADDSLETLSRRVRQAHPNQVILKQRVEPHLPAPLRIRLPQWERE